MVTQLTCQIRVLLEMNNLTAPLAHRNPFWDVWDPIRTSDPPLTNLEYLNDWILYGCLKNPPPTSTATFIVVEK